MGWRLSGNTLARWNRGGMIISGNGDALSVCQGESRRASQPLVGIGLIPSRSVSTGPRSDSGNKPTIE